MKTSVLLLGLVALIQDVLAAPVAVAGKSCMPLAGFVLPLMVRLTSST